jgi:hypothetical protein
LKAKWFVSDGDRELLEYNGFSSFESLWDAKLDWFEEPNYRRHGWSGVSQHLLKRPEGGSLTVFIKRQQNHNFKSLLHPMRGLPTTYREYRNLCKLKEYGIPCPDLVFYGHRNHGGQWQAILMTRSLTGYKPLEDSLNSIAQDDAGARRALLASVAQTLSRMHRHHLRHSCLYAKHIFVRVENHGGSDRDRAYEFDSVVIDLEKMRTGFPLFRLVLHDLDTLCRHWNRKEGDWETFVGSYLARMKWGFLGRKVMDAITGRGDVDCRTGRTNSPVAERAGPSIPSSTSLIPGGEPDGRLR